MNVTSPSTNQVYRSSSNRSLDRANHACIATSWLATRRACILSNVKDLDTFFVMKVQNELQERNMPLLIKVSPAPNEIPKIALKSEDFRAILGRF